MIATFGLVRIESLDAEEIEMVGGEGIEKGGTVMKEI